jgi:hypothetical protein
LHRTHNGMEATSDEIDMEQYQPSALALQKHLLNLRQERAQLEAQGDRQRADHLTKLIANIEETLASFSEPFKPTTLQ